METNSLGKDAEAIFFYKTLFVVMTNWTCSLTIPFLQPLTCLGHKMIFFSLLRSISETSYRESSGYDGRSQVNLGPSLSSAIYEVRSFNLF